MAGKTVFFGPFIGEFGWEFLFWQGWVRKLCRGGFKDYRKIASSYPGRQPFYPYVNEFWTLPESFLKLRTSGHGYSTDGWRGGYPGRNVERYTLKGVLGSLLRLRPPHRIWLELPVDIDDVEPQAEKVLYEFKQRLPEDTVYFVPWKLNYYEPDRLELGMDIPPDRLPTLSNAVDKPVSFQQQVFEELWPTPAGEAVFRRILPKDRKLIAIFPRCRSIRRADKNWSLFKYQELIRRLQNTFPDIQVALFGEPGGAYFPEDLPEGCLDLIHITPERRMDIQIAALKKCILAVGSMSGAMLVALAAGCPALIWGFLSSQVRYYRENVMGTPMIYHADIDPSVDSIFDLSQSFLWMLPKWGDGLNLKRTQGI